MDQPEAEVPDIDVHELLAERERVLLLQIAKLHAQSAALALSISQKETELIQVRRAQIAAGDVNAFNAHCDPAAIRPEGQLDETAVRAFAIVIRDAPLAALPIKGLIVRALLEAPEIGASPAQIREKIERYGRKVEAASVRPNLARLREDGIAMRSVPPKWMLAPRPMTIIAAVFAESLQRPDSDISEPLPGFWDDPFIKAVQAAAWKPEDDAAAQVAPVQRQTEKQLADAFVPPWAPPEAAKPAMKTAKK